jgi:hypothetical protein
VAATIPFAARTAVAPMPIQQVTGDQEQYARGDHKWLQAFVTGLAAGDDQKQRRSEQDQKTALPVNANPPADTRARQRNGSGQKREFAAFIYQETEAKEGQHGGGYTYKGTVNGARNGHARANPVDMAEVH